MSVCAGRRGCKCGTCVAVRERDKALEQPIQRDRWKELAERFGHQVDVQVARAEAAEAEVQRLREALGEIAHDTDHPSWRKAKAIARAALSPEEDD